MASRYIVVKGVAPDTSYYIAEANVVGDTVTGVSQLVAEVGTNVTSANVIAARLQYAIDNGM